MNMLMICSSGTSLTLGARRGLFGFAGDRHIANAMDSLWCASVGGGGSRRTLDVVENSLWHATLAACKKSRGQSGHSVWAMLMTVRKGCM
jgi:hypothetical protein